MTPTKNFSAETACFCSGYGEANALIANAGEYCNAWPWQGGTAMGMTPWCFVSSTADCGAGVKTFPSANVALIGSSGPCIGNVDLKYDTVDKGWFLFLLSLIASAVAACCCCSSFLCGLCMVNSKSREAALATDKVKNGGDKYLWQPALVAAALSTEVAPMPTKTPLMPLDEEFRYFQEEASRKLSDSTPDARRYELYGFYHQAVQGNVQGERPSFFHHEDQMKYDAWARLKGMPRNEAMRGYCNAVKSLPDVPMGNWRQK
jgi:acyl-CoA-binding protein